MNGPCADFHTEWDDVRSLCVTHMNSGSWPGRTNGQVDPVPFRLQTPSIQRAPAQPYGLIFNYDNFRSEPIEQIVDAHRYMETNTQRGKIVVAT